MTSSSSTVPSRRVHGAPVLLAVLSVVLAAPAVAIVPGEQCYSVALHMHGSLSEGLGSMEWHTDRAQTTGVVDAIWWTDHDWRVEHWNHTTQYDFENAVIDGLGRVIEPDTDYPYDFRYWELQRVDLENQEVAVVDSMAWEGSKSLRFYADKDLADTIFRNVYYAQTGSRKQNRYSLARRVRLQWAVYPETFRDGDNKFVVEVRLSDHPEGPHMLRYLIGSMTGEGPETTELSYTIGQWNFYEVDITADAIAKFAGAGLDTLRAEDNDMYEVRIGLETKKENRSALVFFDGYRILSDSTLGGPELMAKSRDFADLYEGMYPSVTQFIGTEISRYRAQPHLNGYTPGTATLVDYTGTTFSDSLFYAVDQIHEQGGAVSLNHVWGTDVFGDTTETQQQKEARIYWKKRDLVAARAYTCDLLEVGYRVRQGIDLEGFLSTWDALTGNSIFLTGHGVTDSHGQLFLDGWGPWIPGDPDFSNNFVTWLYATEFSETAFVHAMKAGRAFFGDPFVFDPDGTLDLWSGEGFPMGRIVLTDRASHDVIVEIDGAPSTAQFRLLQGEIRENPPSLYTDVNYLRDEILDGTWDGTVFTDTVNVDTSVYPSFVRVEVTDQGTATAYSNPLCFVRTPPAAGIPGPRVAAVLGPVQIRRAAGLTLTSAVFTPGNPTIFTIAGDEETPGLGELEIDTGILGQPDGITGASSSSFQNGILTLTGFGGAGSVIQVLWGATGVVPGLTDNVDRLRLEVGRPNPSGDGTVAEFALPRDSSVFLEVLDVQGRRVRLLLDERRPEGVHRVVWDGRDSLGRQVANGVYFLRLSAFGESLTAKAVRVR